MKKNTWTSNGLPMVFKRAAGEDDSTLIRVQCREPPSIVSSATSSSTSVDTTGSTTALIDYKVKLKEYLKIKEADNKLTQKELNMLLSTQQDGTEAKGEMVDPTKNACEKTWTPAKTSVVKQVLAAFAVSLGSLVVGFSSAFTAPALVSMNSPGSSLHVTDSEASWIGSLMPLSALLGGIFGGPLIESIGRRNTIICTGLPFMLAFLLIHFAQNVAMIMSGRFLTGLSVGVASLALPVYLGEIVEARVRGTLGLLPTSLGNLGILLAFTAGAYLDWTGLALLGAILPIPFLISTALISESPLWYISRGKEQDAEAALQWLRGKNADISDEFKGILKSHKDLDTNDFKQTIAELFSRKNMKPFLICVGLMFFQQFSGINAVIFYTVSIFRDAGSTVDSNLCSIIVGAVNLGSTLVATLLIDRLGRKILLYTSNTLMAISLGILSVFFYFQTQEYDISDYGWVPLPTFVIFIFAFAIGAGPIPWLMMGEILPAKIRGAAASIVTAFNWTGTFVVTKTFIDISSYFGKHSAFLMFAVICILGVIFTARYVPETQGKTLEEIEEQLTGRMISFGSIKSKRSTSIAILKPLPSIV